MFVAVQLDDIIEYKQFSYAGFPYWFVDPDKSLYITSKDKGKFLLIDFENRDEFVFVLKKFTNAIEIENKK